MRRGTTDFVRHDTYLDTTCQRRSNGAHVDFPNPAAEMTITLADPTHGVCDAIFVKNMISTTTTDMSSRHVINMSYSS